MDLEPSRIATVTGAPLSAVTENWPHVLAGLQHFKVGDRPVQVAAAATVAVETPGFRPIKEYRASETKNPGLYALQQRYWPSGYYGRGFIQLTWDYNYRAAGQALGIDLLADPDKALDPATAGLIFGWYFTSHGCEVPARQGDWRRVRRIVNGPGLIGLGDFTRYCETLTKEP